MKNQLTSPSARKWQSYNRWRSSHRQLDAARRLEKKLASQAEYVENYVNPYTPAPRVKAFATVTIEVGGERVRFKIHKLPHGLSVSPTLAGKKVQKVLLAAWANAKEKVCL